MAGRTVGVETRGKGRWVYLRATLPPKPGSARLRPYQQRIALQLEDLPHNKQKIRAAAKRLAYEISSGTFDWENWGVVADDARPERTLVDVVEGLRQHMLATRDIKESSFDSNYAETLLRSLPKDRLPTCEDMRAALLGYAKNSSTRRMLHISCKLLAKYMEMECDLADLSGSYSAKMVEPIELPEDSYLVKFCDELDRPDLQYCFGLMVAYGLRPHETWYTEVDKDNARARVGEGKTGQRVVSPLLVDWVERWRLYDRRLPSWTIDRRKAMQARLYEAIVVRRGFQHRLYAIRHCYARRMFEVGVPVPIAAKLMGHAESVHTKTYQRWIDEATVLDAFERFTRG